MLPPTTATRTETSLLALRRQFEQIEQKINAQIKQLKSDQGASSSSKAKVLQQVKRDLEVSFDLRQRLQKAELEAIRGRLQSLEYRIQRREQLRQRIIDRRLQGVQTKTTR